MGERYVANVVDQPGVSSDGLNFYVPCHMWMFISVGCNLVSGM